MATAKSWCWAWRWARSCASSSVRCCGRFSTNRVARRVVSGCVLRLHDQRERLARALLAWPQPLGLPQPLRIPCHRRVAAGIAVALEIPKEL